MLYLLEAPVGIAILQKTEDLSLLAKMVYRSCDAAVQAAEALNGSGDIPEEVDVFLKGNLPEASELNVLNPDLVPLLNARYRLKVTCSSDAVFRQLRVNPFKWFGVNKDAYNAVAMRIAHRLISSGQEDVILVETLNTLEELERGINSRTMRLREWYSLHFPELGAVAHNAEYLRYILLIGSRRDYLARLEGAGEEADGEALPENVLLALKNSMGVDMKERDVSKIMHSAQNVLDDMDHRKGLIAYLKNKCSSAFPNLYNLAGEMVSAKLIRKIGSISRLAQCASSTIQILGAEKAFNEAVKAKTNTPKYGIIYESRVVSRASPAASGKIARALATWISSPRAETLSGFPSMIGRTH